MSIEDNIEQVYIETLGSIETIYKIDELYNPEYECNLIEALKSKKNIIEKAKIDSINRIVYKQKAKFARSIDSLANTDYQDTYHNQTNELNDNLNKNHNNSSINENYEDLKLIENCSANIKKNKILVDTYNNNTKIKNQIIDKTFNIKIDNNNKINLLNYNNNNKASFMNNSILNNKLVEEKKFESYQIRKKLKILKNFDDIDEKIKFGYISVVPKSSLLHINENKFLSYKEIKKEMQRKELERHQKLRESSIRSIQNPTPFQNFEITKNILREKIKFKKDIYANHKSLLKSIIDATDSVKETKRNSLKSQLINLNELTKDERNFMEMSRSNKDNFTKSKLPTISSNFLNNKNTDKANKANYLTIFDKYNSDENKGITNYNNKTGMLISCFNPQFENDKMFHLNSKYQENFESNILEETQNMDFSSLDEKSDCIKLNYESARKSNFSLENSNNEQNDKSSLSVNENYENNQKENKIKIIEQEKLEISINNNNKNKFISNKSESRLSSSFKGTQKSHKKASKVSATSKNHNNDFNNNDISGLMDSNINSQILPTIVNNIMLTNQDLKDEKSKTFSKNNNSNNDLIRKDIILNKEKFNQFNESLTKENKNENKQKEIINIGNTLDSSNAMNKNEISNLYPNKKSNKKINNRSLEIDNSSCIKKENSCFKYPKSEKRFFANAPTFYGSLENANSNNKNNNFNFNKNNIKENKNPDYVNAAKTTLNYLSNALRISNQLEVKKPLFAMNPFINTTVYDNYKANKKTMDKNKTDRSKIKMKINRENIFLENSKEKYANKQNREYIGVFEQQEQQEQLLNNNNKIIKFDKIKNHMRKNSQKDIVVKEMLDDTINDKVEIYKNILNSRDYIPQSEFDIGNTPKFLRPINYNNYRIKSKKNFISDHFSINSDKKNFNSNENYITKNGYSVSSREPDAIFKQKKN